MSKETAIRSTKRGVSFGDVSVSVFTTTTEDTPTLTNTVPLDSGVQSVPSKDSRNNVEDSPKSVFRQWGRKMSTSTTSGAKTRKSKKRRLKLK